MVRTQPVPPSCQYTRRDLGAEPEACCRSELGPRAGATLRQLSCSPEMHVQWPVTATDLRRVRMRPRGIARARIAASSSSPMRQVRGDRRRQRAAGSVRVPARQPRPAELEASRLPCRRRRSTRCLRGVRPSPVRRAGPAARIRSPASRMSSSERIGMPASTSASGMFGVTTCASGSSSDFIAATAALSSRRSPPLAIITGSTTIGRPRRDASVRRRRRRSRRWRASRS